MVEARNDASKTVHANELLEEALRPIWKLTYYSGLLFHWCRPTFNDCFFQTALRYGVIFLALAINVFSISMNAVHLVVFIIQESSGVQPILLNVVACSTLPLSLILHLMFLVRQKDLLSFFQDWKKQLTKLTMSNRDDMTIGLKVNKFIYRMSAIYIGFGTFWVVASALFIFVAFNEISPVWASSSWEYIFAWKMVQWLGNCTNIVFMITADIVPTYVYYHAGEAIQVLAERMRVHNRKSVKTQEDGADDLHSVSFLYDSICRLVARADHLFGPVLVLNHGVSFVLICAMSSLAVNKASGEPIVSVLCLYNLVIFTTRIIWCVIAISQVHKSAELLKVRVLLLLKHGSYPISCKSTLKLLFSQLQGDKLVACPSGLYKITPKILLHMLGLVATYTVILLQSK